MEFRISFFVLTGALLSLSSLGFAQIGPVISDKKCDDIRQEKTLLLERAYEGHMPPLFVRDVLPRLVELTMPLECTKLKTAFPTVPSFNPGSMQEMGGPLGMAGDGTGTIYSGGKNMRPKREAAVADEEILAADENNVGLLSREKRFLHGMSLGGPGSHFGGGHGGAKKEVSESAQMMKTIMMITKYQAQRMKNLYRQPDPNGNNFYGDRVSFRNGLYGDQYPGRKKRSADEENGVNMAAEDLAADSTPLVRKRRFLFTEPGDAPAPPPNPVNQIMSIMMGTATDPNTGKRIKFGGDSMERMMRNQFLNTMPESMRPPPGKEPNDFVKGYAPIWYFQRMNAFMRPQPRFKLKDPGDYPQHMFRRPAQTRNRDGYFGDVIPTRRRMKRSADDRAVDENDVIELSRSKRQSESSKNDVISIGDVSIPLEYFKPREYSDDIYKDRPPNARSQPPPPRHNHYNTYNSYYQQPRQQYNWRQQRQQQLYLQQQQQIQQQKELLQRQQWWQMQKQQQLLRQQQEFQRRLQYYQQMQQRQQVVPPQSNFVYPPTPRQNPPPQYPPTANRFAPPANQPVPPTNQYAPPMNQYVPPTNQFNPPIHNSVAPPPPTNNAVPPPPASNAPVKPPIIAPPPQPAPFNPPVNPSANPYLATKPAPNPAAAPANPPPVFIPPPAMPNQQQAPPPPQQQDPFIYNPSGRKKRSSDDKNKNESPRTPFFPSFLNPNPFSSFYSPRQYNPFRQIFKQMPAVNKLAYSVRGPTGGRVVYGDRLPFVSSSFSSPGATSPISSYYSNRMGRVGSALGRQSPSTPIIFSGRAAPPSRSGPVAALNAASPGALPQASALLPPAGGPAPLPPAGGPAPLPPTGGPAPLPPTGGPAPAPPAGDPNPFLPVGGPAPLPAAGGPAPLASGSAPLPADQGPFIPSGPATGPQNQPRWV